MNNEIENMEPEPVYTSGQMLLFGILAASLLYLAYRGGKYLFGSIAESVSPESKKIVYHTAITVSEIASRLSR